ncbi:MAG: hypothetical protein LBR08_02570 [Bacteroidales bacterium]|jgi:hypothetical protein|nr:hypothetical protein [Bacteroidales bacterium]
MEAGLKRFFIKSACLFGLVVAASCWLFPMFFEPFDFPGRIPSIVLIWAVTCGSHYWLVKSGKHPGAFSRIYMIQIAIRQFVYLAWIAAYLMLFREHALLFVVFFLATYVIFTVFEVISLLKL